MAKHPAKQDIKVATDAVILTVRDGALQVLLIRMKKKPFTGRWALPGGLLGQKETSETAARRILKDQTGVTDAYLEQLRSFDDPKRDPFGRVISIAYVALMPSEGVRLRTTGKYADVAWMPIAKARRLTYDHDRIMKEGVSRVRAKLEYTNVAWSLLPKTFPLSRLREIYEIILGREIDKRNFRKKILSLGLVEATGRMKRGGAHRPAELYRFRERKPRIVELF